MCQMAATALDTTQEYARRSERQYLQLWTGLTGANSKRARPRMSIQSMLRLASATAFDAER